MAGNKKSAVKKVAEAAADVVTLGMYSVSKSGVESLKSRACEKTGGVWKGGQCIPKKEIRDVRSSEADWYPEKAPGEVRNKMTAKSMKKQKGY